MKRLFVFLAVGLFLSSLGFAGDTKTLISWDGAKAGPGLATSWKKGKGSYTFTLDAKADIGQGSKSLADVVKSSLEKRLGASNGVKVTAQGKSTVVVAYSGDEKAFLEAVSKARIRSDQSVEIAQESTVSGGGIRAKTSERDPVDGEVKATVINSKGGTVMARVVTSSAKTKALGINDGDRVEIKGGQFVGVKGDPVFFMPTAKEGNVWGTSQVTDK